MKLPKQIKIGAKIFSIKYVDNINDDLEVMSWLDVDTSTIQVVKSCPIISQKHHIILQLICGITRNLSPDANLHRGEIAFGNTLFSILRSNPALASIQQSIELEAVDILSHKIAIVSMPEEWNNRGELSIPNMELRILSTLKGASWYEVFWHEIIHAIEWWIDRQYKEWQICYFAFCLSSMFIQNDFGWLNEED